MRPKSTTPERVIGWIASRNHGVVTRRQLLPAGITGDEIKHRLRVGSLVREYPGVYRVGHRAPSLEARYMAAVRAGGDGAVLSGRAAGHLHRLLNARPPLPEITTRVKRTIRGVVTHRVSLDRGERTVARGIPVTSVPRTIVDLAGVLGVDDLARACHEAGVIHRTTPSQVQAALARRPGTRGAGNLRRVIGRDAPVTLSRLESAFIALLRENDLPLPKTNRPAGAHRVDCRWPDRRVTVELDSYRYHNSRHAWENDRRRERDARSRGDELRRYTWRDLDEERHATVRDVLALLTGPRALPAGPAGPRPAASS